MKAIKKKLIPSFVLSLMLSFAFSQPAKKDCQTIKRKIITEAKDISDIIPALNGCSILSYGIFTKVKGKVMTASDDTIAFMANLKQFASHCDKDSKIHLELTATCNGRRTSRQYCFKPED